jgi:mRNA interferase HigB
MRVIKPSAIRAWGVKHPAVKGSLENWLATAEGERWTSIVDVRKSFPHADAARVESGNTVTIFNIGGKKGFRLVVAIHYNTGKIYVREFLTHGEYDRQSWKRRS